MPVEPVIKVCIDRLSRSSRTLRSPPSPASSLPMWYRFPSVRVSPALSGMFRPKEAMGITGMPARDFLGSPIWMASSLPLTGRAGVTQIPACPSWRNLGWTREVI